MQQGMPHAQARGGSADGGSGLVGMAGHDRGLRLARGRDAASVVSAGCRAVGASRSTTKEARWSIICRGRTAARNSSSCTPPANPAALPWQVRISASAWLLSLIAGTGSRIRFYFLCVTSPHGLRRFGAFILAVRITGSKKDDILLFVWCRAPPFGWFSVRSRHSF